MTEKLYSNRILDSIIGKEQEFILDGLGRYNENGVIHIIGKDSAVADVNILESIDGVEYLPIEYISENGVIKINNETLSVRLVMNRKYNYLKFEVTEFNAGSLVINILSNDA